MERKRVIVVGGTGYLGQHLLQEFHQTLSDHKYNLAFTHHSTPPPQLLLNSISPSLAFQVDLQTGQGLNTISDTFGQPHVIVNCAAQSVPRVCEADPDAAMAINVPSSLVNWMLGFTETPLLIHLSTDQGIKWMDGVLSKGDKVDFFADEFRCPVYVKDVVAVILALTKTWISDGKQMQLLLNVGGPDRVSRVQMAEAVASVRGYSTSAIKSVSASSVNRGVKSPSDISMDISRLVETLGITPISFRDGVKLTLETEKDGS